MISVISVATSTIVYRYGVPGVPGAGPNHLFNPDDAMLTPKAASSRPTSRTAGS